ncbi:MAG: hypothetical protein ABW156_12120 [Jiangellaceae bacterium]
MTDDSQSQPESRPAVRFDATVHPGAAGTAEMAGVADLDLDRVPDPEGEIRVLIDADDIARLVRQGFEVRVHGEVPVRPIDPALVSDDAAVQDWFEEQVRPARETGDS